MNTDEKNHANDVVVRVNNVSKSFKLPHEQHDGLKRTVTSFFSRKRKRGYEIQHALRGISFEVKKGEFYGIVGRNGSGKSTLLKVLSGIYVPEHGSVEVHGSLVPFIELGVGFNPELTGRENVYMNGALLGFTRKQVSAMYDEIVSFAELEKFMDQKLKNYSSGMQVRLAFSIAIRAESDILVLDEVLAVGDEAFQRKCNEYFRQIKSDKSKTVILVTHSMDAVRKYCDRAVLIKNGKVILDGSPDDVANKYSLENLETQDTGEALPQESIIKDFAVELLSPKQISQNQKVEVSVSYSAPEGVKTYAVVGLQDIDHNIRLFTKTGKIVDPTDEGGLSQNYSFDASALNDVNIKIMAAIYDKDKNLLAFNNDHNSPKLQIRRSDYGERTRTTALLINGDES